MTDSPRKILLLSWELFPMYAGGLGVLIRSVVDELRQQGMEVDVAVPEIPAELKPLANAIDLEPLVRKHARLKSKDAKLKFRLEHFRPSNRKAGNNWPRLFSQQRHKAATNFNLYPNNTPTLAKFFGFAVCDYLQQHPEYDVVIGADWESIPAFRLVRERFPHLPFGFYINATEYDRKIEANNEAGRHIAQLEKEYFKQADFVIAISEQSKKVLVEQCEILEQKITTVYNDVDFKPQRSGMKELNKGKNVLFIGRVELQKGCLFLLETAAKVVEIDNSVRFIIGGDGEELPKLVDLVAEKRLEKNVLFTGWVNDQQKKQLYKSSDLFVMTSPSEPFGLTALEAIRSDVPVIATETSGFVCVVPATPTFKYYDSTHFAQMILFYLNNPKARQELIQTEQAELEQHSWHKEITKLIRVLQKAITVKPA